MAQLIEDEPKSFIDRFYWFIVSIVSVLLLGLVVLLWFTLGPQPLELDLSNYVLRESKLSPLERAALYGSSYGYVSSLLTGLTLAGAIIAIVLQSWELNYQRREVQESQRYWKETANAQRDSQRALMLAAYLNGLVTIVQSSEHGSDESETSKNQAQFIIDRLRSEIETISDMPVGEAALIHSSAKKLQKMLDRLTLEITRQKQNRSQVSSHILDVTDSIDEGLRDVLVRINYSPITAYMANIQQSYDKVSALKYGTVNTSHEAEQQASTAIIECGNIATQLQNMISSLNRKLSA